MTTRIERTLCTLALAGALVAGSALADDASLRVGSVQARLSGQSLRIGGATELTLPSEVEKALTNGGIPLEFVIDVRLNRERLLWWNKALASWRLRRQLYYHALSGQYLVTGVDANVARNQGYGSLGEALRQLGSLDMALAVEAPLDADAEHSVSIRMLLDIETLPPLLRPKAYTTRAWDLNSGWTTWKILR
jgi:hypothetical protein